MIQEMLTMIIAIHKKHISHYTSRFIFSLQILQRESTFLSWRTAWYSLGLGTQMTIA